jgi:hypothetical protein
LNGERKHKRPDGIKGLNYEIKKIFRSLFKSSSRQPKQYRPYLGHSADQPGSSGLQEEKPRESSHHRYHSPHPYRRKSNSISEYLRAFRKNVEIKREERLKRKYKKSIKRKHRREFRKRARVDFIRKFYPQYKKTGDFSAFQQHSEEISDPSKQKYKNYFYYTINSTALFIIAYLLVYLVYQISVLVAASRWKLDSVLFYYDLAFNDYSPLWSRFNIIVVTGSGPVISLLVGVLFYKVFSNRRKVKGFMKLFMLWIAFHGFNFFFGAFSSGVSFDKGFGYVSAWLYLNVFWQIFLSLLFLFILGILSYYSAPKFLDTSNSASRVKPQIKLKFLLYQVTFPYLVGVLIIFLVKLPNNMPYDTGNLITFVFAAVPVLFNRYARPTKSFEGERKPTTIKWWYIVLFVVLLLAFRIGLNNGLHITLFYKFIFSLDITPL